MRYKVTIAAYAICRSDIMELLPPIPGTEQVLELDTSTGAGKEIWWGYLQMRTDQEKLKKPLDDDDWMKIKIHSSTDNKPENEVKKFREAINLFMRFLAGEGRDNCNQVKSIELIA